MQKSFNCDEKMDSLVFKENNIGLVSADAQGFSICMRKKNCYYAIFSENQCYGSNSQNCGLRPPYQALN